MKNRLFFILWLAVLVLLWLPGRLQSAGVILTDSLLAVIVLAIWTYFATKHIKAGFELKGSRNGEKQAVLEIKTNYSGKLPIGLKLKIQSENLLTGQMCEMALGLQAEKKDKWTLEFKSSHAGKLQVMIEAVYVTDLLGLFCFHLKGVERQMLTCLLLPQAAEPPQMPEVFYQYAESSDTYAENRLGADQSQTYELRDYRSGDNFRAIHWKLSSRNESWIVREGSCPIDYRLLLLLENSYEIEEEGEKAETAIEHACACIIALSEDLTDKGIVHHIGWWDKKTQSVCTVEIQSAEDLLLSLGEILAATLEERKRTIWERFQDTCEENRFAQIIVIDDETAKNHSL